jgi:hypothetical protein
LRAVVDAGEQVAVQIDHQAEAAVPALASLVSSAA